jgi:hypothetical protein
MFKANPRSSFDGRQQRFDFQAENGNRIRVHEQDRAKEWGRNALGNFLEVRTSKTDVRVGDHVVRKPWENTMPIDRYAVADEVDGPNEGDEYLRTIKENVGLNRKEIDVRNLTSPYSIYKKNATHSPPFAYVPMHTL